MRETVEKIMPKENTAKAQPIVQCPQCQKPTPWNTNNANRPFCSKRCKLIDFGAWAKEEHVIAGEPAFDEFSIEEELTY